MACACRSTGWTSWYAPPGLPLPNGVRTASTITASRMATSASSQRTDRSVTSRVRSGDDAFKTWGTDRSVSLLTFVHSADARRATATRPACQVARNDRTFERYRTNAVHTTSPSGVLTAMRPAAFS
ncbi:hypothetical protein PSD17_68470 [Pseudonocardia sp. D17]|nr:hypothetical protein PSD17_68470 [Pseudonocardia sp. D17]